MDEGDRSGLSDRARQLKAELLGEFSLTVDDVAGILEVERSTIYRYIQDGALAALKIGREFRLSETDVRGFLEALVERERERVRSLRLRALTGEAIPGSPERAGRSASPFKKYSGRSQQVIVRSQEIARQRGGQVVTCGDMLLALLEPSPDGGGLARKIVEALGADVDALRAAVEETQPPARGQSPSPIPFAASLKTRIMEDATALTRDFGHTYVGTEHLLLALYREQEMAALLVGAGVESNAVEAEIRRWLDGGAASSPGDPPAAQGS